MVKKRPGVWQQVDLIHNIQWLNGSQLEMPPEGLDIQTDDGDGNSQWYRRRALRKMKKF